MTCFLFFSILLSFPHLASSLPSSAVPSTATTTMIISSYNSQLRLSDSDPSLTKSFTYANTSLFFSIPSTMLPTLATYHSTALKWISGNLLPYYPQYKIILICVENVFYSIPNSKDYPPFLIPTMKNLYHALQELEVNIPISTVSFPPSYAQFQMKMITLPRMPADQQPADQRDFLTVGRGTGHWTWTMPTKMDHTYMLDTTLNPKA